MIEIQRGNAAAALAEAWQTFYGTRDANMALALQIGDDRAAADAVLKVLVARPTSDRLYGSIVDVHALRREPDRVFAWLERAIKNDDMDISATSNSPNLSWRQKVSAGCE